MHNRIIATLITCSLSLAAIQTTPLTATITVQAAAKPATATVSSSKRDISKLPYTESDVIKIAKTLYGECRHPRVPMHEKAAVVWCILNRVDSPSYPNTIDKVITKSQFHGYSASHPVWPELEMITRDVLARWYLEKLGISNPGRTLPSNYFFFSDDKKGGNKFRTTYRNGKYWNWSLPSPYKK